jgi:hypothetical protein
VVESGVELNDVMIRREEIVFVSEAMKGHRRLQLVDQV